MRKLIIQEWMSLDGYVADKNGNLDFFTNISIEENKYSDKDQLQFMEEIDTILLGRKTYELFVDFWPEATTDMEVIAEKLNSTISWFFQIRFKVRRGENGRLQKWLGEKLRSASVNLKTGKGRTWYYGVASRWLNR
jgi:dihydrofolate reductase